MIIEFPDTKGLVPEEYPLDGGELFLFRSENTELARMDVLFEAGTFYQPRLLTAGATAHLLTAASGGRSTDEIAEWLDYRGIIVEHCNDYFTNGLTFYTHRRFLPELIEMLRSMLLSPAFEEKDVKVYCDNKRVEIANLEQHPSSVARKLFYKGLFGEEHILGKHATIADVNGIDAELLHKYHSDVMMKGKKTVVLSGGVGDDDVKMLQQSLSGVGQLIDDRHARFAPDISRRGKFKKHLDSAAQTNIRVGRVLPMEWDTMEYARFQLLTMVLGGYFGSRLMSNLREERGLTYGIYARTQIYRGCLVFYITADVAKNREVEAEEQIVKELLQLSREKIDPTELDLVRNALTGDFIRSVDGVFECASRFCDMHCADVDERFTNNLQRALLDTDSSHLQELAQRLLKPEDMTVSFAGCVAE